MSVTLRHPDGDNDVLVDDDQVEHWTKLGYRIVGPPLAKLPTVPATRPKKRAAKKQSS